MATERLATQEDQSVWYSWLFRIGIVAAVVGALIKAKELITVGLVAAGAAWALWRGKGK